MIRNLFAPLAMKIAAGICAALVLALAVQSVRLSAAHALIARMERDAAEVARKAVQEARDRDAAARVASDASKARADAEIDRARDAAKDAADPWGAAIGAMR